MDESLDRLREFDAVVQEHGWSPAVCAALQARWGLSQSQVYLVRKRWVTAMRNGGGAVPALIDSKEERRADFIAEVRMWAQKAMKAQHFGAGFSGMRLVADCEGFREPERVQIDGQVTIGVLTAEQARALGANLLGVEPAPAIEAEIIEEEE